MKNVKGPNVRWSASFELRFMGFLALMGGALWLAGVLVRAA